MVVVEWIILNNVQIIFNQVELFKKNSNPCFSSESVLFCGFGIDSIERKTTHKNTIEKLKVNQPTRIQALFLP